jgi:signal transduction histidine kinase
VARVLQSGQPQLTEQVEDAQLVASAWDAEHLRLLRELNPQSSMMLPITIHGRALGVITLASSDSGRYSADDLVLAGEVARRAGLAVDNARLYQEAQAARAHAEQAVQLRDQFLSIVAHELRTPLTSLKGYAELFQRRIAREGTLNERDRNTLRVIVNQTDRLNRMISALFDLSRIQLGQLSIERAPIDIGALACQIVEEIQPTLTQHTIEIYQLDTPLIVDGDALRLEQVIQNLVQNAIKYSPAGGLIELRIERREEWACVAVTDYGIGIPQTALSQLFQRFYRAGNVGAHQISGMGIGLYVVKEIVVLHGGMVQVTSSEGEGSTFTIYLPRLDSTAIAQDRRQLQQVGNSE